MLSDAKIVALNIPPEENQVKQSHTTRGGAPIATTAEELIARAIEQPGLREVLEVYQHFNRVVAAANIPQLIPGRFILSSSDTSGGPMMSNRT